MILWGEAMTELYAVVRCSTGCSQQRPSPGLQLAIITIDLKLYLGVCSFIVDKVLPHFISATER